jgi:predicted dehydrogenase
VTERSPRLDSSVTGLAPVGIGLVGVGRWGTRWFELLRASNRVDLLWACDRVRPAVLDEAPEVNFTPDLSVCLSDPRVRAVVLATPIETHENLARLCLGRNKDVLLEKPAATSLASLDGLLARARERGRLLAVNHLLLHHPAVIRMREEIVAGTIGELHSIVSLRVSQGNRVRECPWWTLAPHDLALIDTFTGGLSPSSVRLEQHGHEVRATLAAPVRAELQLSLCGSRKARLFVAQGTRATLVFDDLQRQPLSLHTCSASDLPLDERLLRGKLGFGRALTVPDRRPLDAVLDAFVARLRDASNFASDDDGDAHMRRVVAALERGRPFAPTIAPVLLEVPA